MKPATTRSIRSGTSRILAGIGLSLVLAMAPGCDRPSRPLAHVGSEWVGQPEWAAFLLHAGGLKPDEALAALARREVLWTLAGRQGLLKGEEWQRFVLQSRMEVLGEAYLASLGGQHTFTETEARALFFSQGEQRHLLQVVCKTQPEAEAALAKIRKGAAIATLADAVSTDAAVAKNHGDMGWINRGMLVEPLEGPIFAASAGTCVGPVQTSFGWHVISVQEVRTPTEADYQARHAEVLERLRKMSIAMKKPEATKDLRGKFPLVADKEVLARDHTTEPAPGDEKLVAGKVAGTTINLRDLKIFLASALNTGGSSHSLGPQTKTSFMEILADDIRMSKIAEKEGLQKQPQVKAAIWDAQRSHAAELFAKGFLERWQLPEADAKAHHDLHSDRFLGVGAVRVNLLLADQPAEVEAAARESVKGIPWKQIVAKHANPETTGNWDPGFLEMAALGRILPPETLQTLGTAPLGSLVGPLNGPDGYLLLKILERKPGGVVPYADCKDAVRQDYLKDHGTEILDRYLDGEGRKGIPVRTYPENLR